jgi:uncharacterized damage-inducible protein DinB
MSPEDIRLLYDYNAWANQRVMQSTATLTSEQFIKPMGSSFSSVRDTLAHIWGAEWVWLERFQGRSPACLPDVSQFEKVSALRTRWDEDQQHLLKFVARQTQRDLDRILEYQTFKFGQYTNPLWQSMQHLVNHGTYHRGQIVTMARQLGAAPLSSDLMHFYRERSQSVSN